MNEALGDVSKGVFFDFVDRDKGFAQVEAGVFGPRGVALASYHITESQTVLPGAATHIQFERPLTGTIEKRHADTCLVANSATSILSSPADTDFAWRPRGQSMHCISMSLPVSVLQEFLVTAQHPYSIGTKFVEFGDSFAGRDTQFVELMSYLLNNFERMITWPKQGDFAESLLLETFVNMSTEAGFISAPETAGLRLESKGSTADERLVARAEDYIRSSYHEPLFMPQVAENLGVSLRKLQKAFSEQRGITPRQCLVKIRLEAARALLSEPGLRGNVTSVALDCGFVHLGRFSQAYVDTFGEHPSSTLSRTKLVH